MDPTMGYVIQCTLPPSHSALYDRPTPTMTAASEHVPSPEEPTVTLFTSQQTLLQ
jgi:hypothetical protein